MSSDLTLRERMTGALAGLAVTRSEGAALALLALFGVLALAVVWWAQTASGRVGDAAAGTEATADGGDASGLAVERPAAAVVVHVAGLVAAPGVHELPAGARVADALAAAGGPLPEAWLDGLNLARPVNDGEQLVVPAWGADDGAPDAGGGPAAPVAGGIRPDGTVDLNRATAAELETLPGVGPVTAERIVLHREEHGPFTAVGQLRDVHGIGEKTFQSLADLVSV